MESKRLTNRPATGGINSGLVNMVRKKIQKVSFDQGVGQAGKQIA